VVTDGENRFRAGGENFCSCEGVLEYADVDGSTKAKTHGRKFGGNQVVSVIYPEDKFAAEQYDG